MSQIFAFVSALIAAMLILGTLKRYATARDCKIAVIGFAFIFLFTAGLAQSGVLSDFTAFPPRFMLFFLGLLTSALFAIFSPWGTRVVTAIPLRVLIGLQGFRIMPEILLDLAFREGLAPIQMTWHGRNFDIISAILALILAGIWPLLKNTRPWAWTYSFIGLGLLINIVGIAILSAPVPFRVFMNEPANTFVATFPYIWLPAIHVLIAMVLHGWAFRRLKLAGSGVFGPAA